MPTSREIVLNKGLSGPELQQVILNDVTRMLSSNGFLSPHLAYRRVAYDLRVTLHLDLPSVRDSEDRLASQPATLSELAADPALAALEPPPPLATPSPESVVSRDTLHRDITSPNLARIEHDLPVDIATRDNDGHTIERQVPGKSWEGTEGAAYVVPDIVDASAEARVELGLPAEPASLVPEVPGIEDLSEDARRELGL